MGLRMGSFGVEANMCMIFLSVVYICIAVGDPVIKRRWVEIQLSRGGGVKSSYQEEEG